MTLRMSLFLLLLACPLSLTPSAQAQNTQFQYLSGHDKDDAVPWDFRSSAGRRSGSWTTIPVPSNWELQGFGRFTYGNTSKLDKGGAATDAVEGQYKRTFSVPAAWSARRTFLVFEGVMTDAQVSVNGQSAGPMHQGGYYRFQYEVTKSLKYGRPNQLEVTVEDESADASINRAERRGDYWNYAGIYRPVYLESVPTSFIERVAVNAQASGDFAMNVYGNGTAPADTVEAQILEADGSAIGAPFSQPIPTDSGVPIRLQTHLPSPRLWTAETPNLYQVEVRLKRGPTTLHVLRQRFGFRTIELRPGDGIYVNGKRVLLKGSCRHTFWPDSGRCTSDKISRLDIGLMKDMNMNAVRMSHYPPDQHFLDDCDELGLYVLDELGGWQHAYATDTGRRLVREMVVRDVNHPSILFWDNANEGGWNTAVDDNFARWDPQGRHVIHPGGGTFRDINDTHYPSYTRVQQLAAGDTVFLPTEFLHGLYDGGAGSGLADYWDVMRQSKVGGGGFIWAFLDESVKRVDLDGHLDTNGNSAPDGIVGPYREKEGSFYAIKEVWSPLVIPQKTLPPDFHGSLTLENRYDFTDARLCRFTWELRRFRRPSETDAGYSLIANGSAPATASIPPGATGTLALDLPANWRQADALALRADDPQGREVWTWVWPFPHADDYRAAAATPGGQLALGTETAGALTVRNGYVTLQFSKATGLLTSVQRAGHTYPLSNGPRPVVGEAALASFAHHAEGTDYVINATYAGGMKSVQWRVRGNGWVQLDYDYALQGPQDFFGVGFDLPESDVRAMTWLGDGPYRAWKNRIAGEKFGEWHNTYNDTITGDSLWQYPEFKGYYADVRWVKLQTTAGPITAVVNQDGLDLQVLTPKFPRTAGHTVVAFPAAGLSLLHAIPPIGSKFASAAASGPSGRQAVAAGAYHGSVSFYFSLLSP